MVGLQRNYDIYLCKQNTRNGVGTRFYYSVLEGLFLHLKIRVVDDPLMADIIVYLPVSTAWLSLNVDINKYMVLRVLEFLNDYAKSRKVEKFIAGQVDGLSRKVINNGYFKIMNDSKIVVTANPSYWEGDSRLMEALIFVDHMYVPRPHPLIHGVHVIYYDNNNQIDLFKKLDYYRE